MSILLYSIPFSDKHNAYFELLHAALEAQGGIEIKSLPRYGLLGLLANTERTPAATKKIITIHWSTVLYGSRYALKSFLMIFGTAALLYILKYRGYKICWTMHNAYAHDYPHPLIDRLGRYVLGYIADGIVVQQQCTYDALSASIGQRKKMCFVAHGNYSGAYGPVVPDRDAIKRNYGCTHEEIVFLVFGAVRPYKKIDSIIQVFKTIDWGNKKVKLYIVGKADETYSACIRRASEGCPHIVFENRYIPNDELPRLLGVADVCVFYYDNSEMTSGGMLLALSYGVPVIIRDIAAAEIIQPASTGWVFRDDAELKKIFQKISTCPLPRGDAIIQSVAGQSWEKSARKLVRFYTDL